MRSWIRLIALLYPKDWRQRYGTEFDALLEEAKPRWGDTADVLRAALEVRSDTGRGAIVRGVLTNAVAVVTTQRANLANCLPKSGQYSSARAER